MNSEEIIYLRTVHPGFPVVLYDQSPMYTTVEFHCEPIVVKLDERSLHTVIYSDTYRKLMSMDERCCDVKYLGEETWKRCSLGWFAGVELKMVLCNKWVTLNVIVESREDNWDDDDVGIVIGRNDMQREGISLDRDRKLLEVQGSQLLQRVVDQGQFQAMVLS